MLTICISGIDNFIEKTIRVVKFYWLEKNKEIHIYPYNFQCVIDEDNMKDRKYTFTFTSFLDGNFEVSVEWKPNPLETPEHVCRIQLKQTLKDKSINENEFHSIEKQLYNSQSIYFGSTPYVSEFGKSIENNESQTLSHDKENENDKNNQGHYIQWYTDESLFIRSKSLLKKQIRYSDRMFWNVYWYQLHMLTTAYPENPSEHDKDEIRNLIQVMKEDGIPCNICKQHFIVWTQMYPGNFHLTTKNKLIKYFFDLHNDINKRNGKNEFTKKEFDAKYVHPLGKVFTEQDIKWYGVDILEMLKNRTLNAFPSRYMEEGNRKIQEYVLSIPNFESMVI